MRLCYFTKYIYYFLVTLTLLVLGTTVFFLYNNFYCTLAQAKVVYILRNQVAFEAVDMNLWQQVLESFQNKKNPHLSKTDVITDPFKILEETITIQQSGKK